MTVAETNQHYDLDPRIFELFLGETRKYSSGLYRNDSDSLDTAQRNKLHYVAGRLALRPGQRLLDIGSGWGALILFVAANYGVSTVGVSPAPNQRDYVAARAAERGLTNRVRVRTGRVEDITLERRGFDAITMLGSIVHMPNLAEVFTKCRAALRPGGMLYVSESCYRNAAKRAEFSTRPSAAFVRESIFGWGDLRPLSDLVRGAEDAGLTITAVDDLTAHYHRTIEDWLANVAANADRLDAISEGLADDLTRYLRTANAGWGFTTKHYALVCRNKR
ncbi:class I SAM-dependent methyltransferase [Solihabitans fulvus]|uniref:Class I SAM-dependent methyltransferase n=1 Tax=Solihabitans fulvus TaxID=1892852 RepID=A0A5B2WPW0_9PSEU|nr:class I SAM-dependent methyltransferase [Solihabitans fulvus]KAA2252820.1 class I SAM-dependent methyltransferase [Solihabitans fulvus]